MLRNTDESYGDQNCDLYVQSSVNKYHYQLCLVKRKTLVRHYGLIYASATE